MGLQKDDIIVRVRPFDDTSQLELNAADAQQAHEIIQIISTYVTDGAKAEANANIQWIDMQKQQANQIKRKQLVNKARNLIPGQSSATTSTETAVTTTSPPDPTKTPSSK